MKARIESVSFSRDGESLLTLATREDVRSLWDELSQTDVDVSLKKYREGRNLSQNGLYWASLTQLARKLGVSNNHMHNLMIRNYGQPEIFDDKVVYTMLPDTDDAERKALEADTYHIKPTSKVKHGSDGVNYRAYMLMRGSSTYNTEEFSRLLDGLLEACEDMGIHVQTGREDGQ